MTRSESGHDMQGRPLQRSLCDVHLPALYT